ncbi:helix-turn-helix domain-containing protein [Emticicia sp. C21]|uniref:helix-turn-helix domain-containing protein n=1 Tax=Emticicia sp. C21 TaxID=2302915 RepID=UPI000E348FEA|nr:helix-turn-helix domain-containing protein [Emticicia sp. C21]RFS17361.1 DNA-binding protein [Emticicia sp. C21]
MKHTFLNPYEVIFEKLQSIESTLVDLKPQSISQSSIPPEEKFLDVKQTAELFGVSTVSIWAWEKAQILKSYRIGNLKRFKYSELLESPKLINRR